MKQLLEYMKKSLNKKIINREEPKYQGRYNWTSEEQHEFNQKYLLKAAQESNLMPGFLAVYDRIKKFGFEIVVITARGGFVKEMKDDDSKRWICQRNER